MQPAVGLRNEQPAVENNSNLWRLHIGNLQAQI